MSTEWMVEEPEPGWLGRLIAPRGGRKGRPATASFLVGITGAVAFALSMIFDWGTVTVTQQQTELPGSNHFSAGVANLFTLGLAYSMGVIALLGVAGAVVTSPDLAVRLRLAASGVTVGLTGVVVAATAQMPNLVTVGFENESQMKTSIELGLFFAYAAVILPAVSIWLSARPASRPAVPVASPVVEADEPDEEDGQPYPPQYGARGLSVSGGPVDLTVTPG